MAGIGRSGDTLHPLGETDLTGVRLERLPLSRRFAPGQLGGSREQGAARRREARPGRGQDAPPPAARRRLAPAPPDRPRAAAAHALGDGEPGVRRPARGADRGGRLVLLGERVPTRDEAMERALVARLRDELHLVPGRAMDFDGPDAIRFAQKLHAWKGGGAEAAARELFGGGKLVPRLAIDDDRFDVSFESGARGRGRGRGGEGAGRARGRGGGDPRVARRAAAGAARGRGLGAAAGRVAGEARRARGGPPRGEARGREGGAGGAARAGRALRRARRPAAGELRAPRAAHRGLRAHPGGAAPGGPHGLAAPLPAAGRELALVPPRRGARRGARRRHGPRQDAAGALRGPRARARGLPAERGAQLGGRDPPLPPLACARASTTARGARSTPPPTSR